MGRERIAPYVHRPLAARVVPGLLKARVPADAVTVVALAMALLAGVMFSAGRWWLTIAAAVVYFGSTILDCADGAVARATGTASVSGAWLDTIADRIAEAAIALGVTAAFARDVDGSWPWIVGLAALAGSFLASYGRKEFRVRFGRDLEPSLVDDMTRRDVKTLLVVVGGLALVPFWALVVSGVLGFAALVAQCRAAFAADRSRDSADR